MDRRAPFIVFLVWLALAPLLWGSVAEIGAVGDGVIADFRGAGGPYAVFRGLGYLSLALLIPTLLGWFGGDQGTRVGGRMLLLVLSLIALAALQLVPIPTGVYSLLAPAHARDLAVLTPGAGWAPISTDPGYTGRAVVHLFLLLAAALVVYHAVRTPRRAWITLGVVIGVAAVGAGYGILETRALGDQVLGQPKPDTGGGVTGTFFYRGNFAALTATALAMAGVALMAAFGNRRRAVWIASALGAALLALGLIESRSRAGLLAGGIGLAVGLFIVLRNRRLAWAGFAGVIALMVAAALLVPSLRERFGHLSGEGSRGYADIRLNAWSSTLELAAGRPVLGAGFGAYRRAIHLTQSENIPDELYFAHSDPLNILAEGGVLGLLIVLTLAVSGFTAGLRLARDREHPASGVGAVSIAGLTALLVMSILDFPLQIPATSLVFTVLLFLPVAMKADPVVPREAGTSRMFLARTAAFAGLALLLIGIGEDYRRGLADPGTLTRGEVHFERGKALLEKGDLEGAKVELTDARRLQPFEGGTRLYLAEAAYRTGDITTGEAEVRATYHLARGRAVLLFSVGLFSLRDRRLADLTVEAFREASALEERFFPEVIRLPRVSPELLAEIVPEREATLDLLGRHYVNLGRSEAANEAFLRAVKLGARGEILKRLKRTYVDLGRAAEGRREFAGLGVEWPE